MKNKSEEEARNPLKDHRSTAKDVDARLREHDGLSMGATPTPWKTPRSFALSLRHGRLGATIHVLCGSWSPPDGRLGGVALTVEDRPAGPWRGALQHRRPSRRRDASSRLDAPRRWVQDHRHEEGQMNDDDSTVAAAAAGRAVTALKPIGGRR